MEKTFTLLVANTESMTRATEEEKNILSFYRRVFELYFDVSDLDKVTATLPEESSCLRLI